jgi:hypothetical protein
MPLTISTSTTLLRVARFGFDGLGGPVLDERFDETPPTYRGSLTVPIVSTSSGSTVTLSDSIEEIERYYRDQGITAADLVKMVGQDALDRVPVATIRSRTFADVPTGTTLALRLRGVVTEISVIRTVTDAPVPAELPP